MTWLVASCPECGQDVPATADGSRAVPDTEAVREAEAWFRERDVSDALSSRYLTQDALKHAASIVRAWLARDVPTPAVDPDRMQRIVLLAQGIAARAAAARPAGDDTTDLTSSLDQRRGAIDWLVHHWLRDDPTSDNPTDHGNVRAGDTAPPAVRDAVTEIMRDVAASWRVSPPEMNTVRSESTEAVHALWAQVAEDVDAWTETWLAAHPVAAAGPRAGDTGLDVRAEVKRMVETNDRLRSEVAELKQQRDYLQGQLDIIYRDRGERAPAFRHGGESPCW